MRWKAHVWAVVALAALTALVAVPAATTAPAIFPLAESQGFRKAVTLDGVREHQAALQTIATANGGIRASGTTGFNASKDYVVDKLEAAGYSPTVLPFTFNFFRELAPAELSQVSPTPTTYQTGTFSYSGSGDVTAGVTPVDVVVPIGTNPPNTSTSGCEASDFGASTVGKVALIQRGSCNFSVKAMNAQAAGALAVVIFNEGQPGRDGLIVGTLGAPVVSIPVVGLSYADGAAIYNQTLGGPVTLHVKTSTESEVRETYNVMAETEGGDASNVVVIGAHLDSVLAGPGINDNGSGSATILEVAEVYAAQNRVPRNKLRFMWFGAEELGLVGSANYVASLSPPEKDRIALMLNFDMVGSPNFVRFVYDGDNSAFPPGAGTQVGPPGSGAIEQAFRDYFAGVGLPNEPTPFSGRSDYGPFITTTSPSHPNGIPAGGLFTGAEGIKTAAQQATYGGTAGQQYDPCYHQACDTFANNSNTGLDQMSDAVAHAVLLWSKRNFVKEPLVTP